MAEILLLAPDLAAGPVYTAHQFGGALSGKHRVRLVGPSSGGLRPPLQGELEPDGVLPGSNPLSRSVRRAFEARIGGADLIYAFQALPQSFGLALWAPRRRGLRVALHLDDWDGGWFAESGALRRIWHAGRSARRPNTELWVRLMEALVPRANAVTVSSRALQRRFGGTLVRQGVDISRVSPACYPRETARARIGAPADRAVVLFLGMPPPHKGLADLLDACGRLPPGAVAVWIVGSPADPRQHERLRAAAGSGVELRPRVSFEEACWMVAACDVFAVPQRATRFAQHQFPAKLAQATALGAPIVATDVGDAREILGGERPAGLVVPGGDRRALADALAALVRQPQRARELGAEARQRAERLYGWPAMARQLDGVLATRGPDE